MMWTYFSFKFTNELRDSRLGKIDICKKLFARLRNFVTKTLPCRVALCYRRLILFFQQAAPLAPDLIRGTMRRKPTGGAQQRTEKIKGNGET